jgi:hypothetical protein
MPVVGKSFQGVKANWPFWQRLQFDANCSGFEGACIKVFQGVKYKLLQILQRLYIKYKVAKSGCRRPKGKRGRRN